MSQCAGIGAWSHCGLYWSCGSWTSSQRSQRTLFVSTSCELVANCPWIGSSISISEQEGENVCDKCDLCLEGFLLSGAASVCHVLGYFHLSPPLMSYTSRTLSCLHISNTYATARVWCKGEIEKTKFNMQSDYSLGAGIWCLHSTIILSHPPHTHDRYNSPTVQITVRWF